MPNLVAQHFGEPERTIGPNGNTAWTTARGWKRELTDRASGSDAPDLARFFEPEVAVWSDRDSARAEVRTGKREFARRRSIASTTENPKAASRSLGKASLWVLCYAHAPRAQVERLLHFRHTHAPRRLLVERACWECLLGGQGNEVILLLPGGPCIAECNFERILALERRSTVLSPSDPAQVSSMAQIVGGLVSILEYEGMTRVHLIGISLSGMEAQCFVQACLDDLFTFPERESCYASEHVTFLCGKR